MITEWSLHNFKSAKSPVRLPFSPLTLFAGANSSGKSTLIQSILLIAQTFASKVPSRQCVLNGNLVSLGTFSDLRSTGSDFSDIKIGWECKPLSQSETRPASILFPRRFGNYNELSPILSSAACSVSFRSDPSAAELADLQPIPSRIELTATTGESNAAHSCLARRASDADIEAKVHLLPENPPVAAKASLAYNVELDGDSTEQIRAEFASAETVGCFLHHFLPRHIAARVHVGQELMRFVRDALRDEVRPRHPRTLMFEDMAVPEPVLARLREQVPNIEALLALDSMLPGIQESPKRPQITFKEWLRRYRRIPAAQRLPLRKKLRSLSSAMEGVVPEFELHVLAPAPIPPELSAGADYLDDFFANRVKYLGPLRDEPKAIYPRGSNPDPSDVGLRGESTAAVLQLHRSRPVKYLRPANFGKPSVLLEAFEAPLEHALTEWLQYLGVASSFRTQDMGRHGHELRVAPQRGRQYDLTHVGVGLSQVLPILVSALLAERDTALIFEQPELHLHPKVQTRLADFFLSMALLDKQCIIETHSEYLVNQLRFRMAASESPPVTSASKVYFVENRGEGSVYREIGINRYGAILDWPADFFDQAQRQSEELLIAAARKRHRENQG